MQIQETRKTAKSIVQLLEDRANNRQGMLKPFPVKKSFDDRFNRDVWITPLMAAEFHSACEMGAIYAKGNSRDWDSMASDVREAILEDSQVAAIVFMAVRDPITKDKLFTGPNEVAQLCKLMTIDEIASLKRLVDIVSCELNAQDIVNDKEKAMFYASLIHESNSTQAIELFQVIDLISLCKHLADEVARLQQPVVNEQALSQETQPETKE